MRTPIYFHIAKKSNYDPTTLTGEHATRVDYLNLQNGDRIGRASAIGAACRRKLEEVEGITVLPPLHRQVKSEHLGAFGYCGAKDGDTGYDVAEKLHTTHQMFWLHPEESAE